MRKEAPAPPPSGPPPSPVLHDLQCLHDVPSDERSLRSMGRGHASKEEVMRSPPQNTATRATLRALGGIFLAGILCSGFPREVGAAPPTPVIFGGIEVDGDLVS